MGGRLVDRSTAPENIPMSCLYIYARGYAGGKYTESTSDLDFLLTLEAGSKMGIYQLSPGALGLSVQAMAAAALWI